MKLLPSVSKRAYVVGGTFLVLMVVFGFYLLIYLPNQEDKIIKQRVRALDQIAQSFKEKRDVFKKNAIKIETNYSDYLKTIDIFKAAAQLEKEIYTVDSLMNADQKRETALRERKSILVEEKSKLEHKKSDLEKQGIGLEEEIKKVNTYIKGDFLINKNFEIAEPGVDTISNLIFASGKQATYPLKTSLAAFFQSLMREDIFDEYLIYKYGKPAYQTTQGTLFLITEASENEKKTQKAKKLIPVKRDTTFGEVVDVKLGTVDYKLFSTYFTTDKTNWSIYGLISKEHFEAEKRSVPPLLVISLSVILLLIVFAMPLMKLIFMSPIERLHQRNVIHSAGSFILSFGLVTLCILSLDSYFVDSNNRIDKNLQILSQKIKTDFDEEVRDISTLIDTLDSKPFKTDISNNTSISIYYGKGDSLLKENIKIYPFFKYIFWMDSVGKARYEYANAKHANSTLDSSEEYGERFYFKAIHNREGWYLSNDNKDSAQFMIESILSWDKGENSAVISKPSRSNFKDHKAEVVALSSNLYSVIDPVLPPGYQFCIIDREGKVLFHSDKHRNLQENYIEEINSRSTIISAILGNTFTFTDVNYYNKDQRTYIQSLDNAPLYLITTFDKNYSRSPYSQIIIFTLVSMILIGLAVALLSSVISLLYYRSSKLKKLTFSFEWLRPYSEMRNRYMLVFALNILYLFTLGIYNTSENVTPFQTFASFIYATLLSYTFSFAILQQKKDGRYWLMMIITLALLYLLFSIVSLLTGTHDPAYPLLLLTIAMIFFLISSFEKQIKGLGLAKTLLPLSRRSDHKKAYLHMMFSFFLMSSVLPVILLFMKFYEQEMFIWEKSALYQISKNIEERDRAVDVKYATLSMGNENPLADSLKAKGLHCSALGYQKCEAGGDSLEASKYDTLIYQIRPFFNELIVNNNGFIYPHSENRKWQTAAKDKEVIFTYDKYPDKLEKTALAFNLPQFFNPTPDHLDFGNIIFILILIGTLAGMYIVLRIAVQKFFTWNLLSEKDIFRVDDKYLYGFKYLKQHANKQNLFIVSLPFAGVQTLRRRTVSSDDIDLKFKGKPRYSLSQIYDQKVFEDIYDQIKELEDTTVVLEHFGYNAKNVLSSNRKLQLLEKLLLNGNNLIIISGIRPIQIIELYEKQLENYDKLPKEEKEKVNQNDYIDIINRWKDILSGFVKIYPSPEINRKLKPDGTVREIIDYECGASPYFDKIQEFLMDLPEETLEATDKRTKEEVLLKLQSMAQSFYFSLWNTCTKEEKYLLYDLATDDFVNTKNIQGIILLIEKGLAYYDHDEQLHVMNESFRNFILTTVKKPEALEMEKELLRTGTWSIFKAVIIVLVISMVLFVSFAEQTLLDNFLAIMAGFTAIVSYLLRLGGWFTSPSGSSKMD